MKDKIFVWKPDVALGPVEFGQPVQRYVESLDLRICENPFKPGEFECYSYGEDMDPAYYADDEDRVENIVCFEKLIFEGQDLIGKTLEEVIQILGQEPEEIGQAEEGLDGEVEVAVEYDNLGLQIWIVDGVSQSAIVSKAFQEDDE